MRPARRKPVNPMPPASHHAEGPGSQRHRLRRRVAKRMNDLYIRTHGSHANRDLLFDAGQGLHRLSRFDPAALHLHGDRPVFGSVALHRVLWSDPNAMSPAGNPFALAGSAHLSLKLAKQVLATN